VRDALDALPAWLAPYLARLSVQIDERPPPGEENAYALFDGPRWAMIRWGSCRL